MKAESLEGFLPLVGIAGLLPIWSLTTWQGWGDRVLLPRHCRPSRPCGKAWTGACWVRLYQERYRTAASTAIAPVIAIPLGIVLGSAEWLYGRWNLSSIFSVQRRPPQCFRCSWWFGVGDETKISVAAFGAALVIASTRVRRHEGPRDTLLAAKVMGASRLRVLFDVMLRESLPQTLWDCERPGCAGHHRAAEMFIGRGMTRP